MVGLVDEMVMAYVVGVAAVADIGMVVIVDIKRRVWWVYCISSVSLMRWTWSMSWVW